jgi:hypothetical protein
MSEMKKPEMGLPGKMIDETRLSIFVPKGEMSYCVMLDNKIPLWRTAVPLEELCIFLYTPESTEEDTFCLMCRDTYEDLFTYGDWESLEEAEAWLANPVPLY